MARSDQTAPAARLDPRAPLPALCVITGNEHLLVLETADALRLRANSEGFTERHSHVMDARSDWGEIFASAGTGSLFGDKQLIEISLPTGKPGKAGADALVELSKRNERRAADDVFTIVRLPGLDRATRESRWAKALLSAGKTIEIADVSRQALPDWIGQRLAKQGQVMQPDTLQWLADRVEGNLLAAHQEILKLGLLYPEGEIEESQCQSAVMNVARYDVFALRDAMLEGDGPRALRVLWGLRAEGEALPLVLWAVGEEIRTLEKASRAVRAGQDIGAALKEQRVFGVRDQKARLALRRVPAARWARAVMHAHDVDRLIKGIPAKGRLDDPWEELARLTLSIAVTRAS
jgi:DNA polymerase III subunit delta